MRRVTSDRLAEHLELKSELDRLQSIHNSMPDQDEIYDLARRRDSLREELASVKARDAVLAKEVEFLEREWERGERSLEAVLDSRIKESERNDDRTRIVHSAAKVRRTLADFQNAIVKRHLARIEQLVLECYQHLLRKSSLVTDLSIDPETFVVNLYGRNREELPTGTLSAGERQLLAVALLWGLAKASGRPLPTAIDTPLGRLDADHRRQFVEHYLPFASHQTLLFSTNEEIVGDYLEQLTPFIGRYYLLKFDDSLGSTSISPGYFDQVGEVNGN